jgi:ABC-type sugar transport system permease subunit
LGSTSLALGALIVVDIWKWFGFHMVINLAGLQSIPAELYESARMDGANGWDCFWRITLPLLQPVTLINVTLATLGAFNVFDLVYVMTTGGPANSTNVAMMEIYTQAFQFYRFGYAAAMSFVLLALVSIIALVVLRALRSERYF